MRRHLLPAEARAVLDRGATVEQFLGFRTAIDGRPTLAYVWLVGGSPLRGRVEHVFDEGDPDHLDLASFEEVVDPVHDWDPASGQSPDEGDRAFESAEEALKWATLECGASDGRWVNAGMVQDEYRDAHGWRG